jgi:hypothetical protein
MLTTVPCIAVNCRLLLSILLLASGFVMVAMIVFSKHRGNTPANANPSDDN